MTLGARSWVLVAAAALLLLLLPPLPLAGAAPAESACGAKCDGTCNEEVGRCDCLRGFMGDDCTTPMPDLPKVCRGYKFKHSPCSDAPDGEKSHDVPCVNACNARGTCHAGVCKCEPGFYGTDCSLSLDSDGKPVLLAGLGYKPRDRRPHVYVYELPPKYTTWWNVLMQDRPMAHMLHARLLGSGVRVANGDDADLFFVPVNVRNPTDSGMLLDAINYIRRHHPWWDRHGGGRHLLMHAGDPGRADVYSHVQRITENATYLHHFGLMQDYEPSHWKASHRPGIDIVLPMYLSPSFGTANLLRHSPLHPLSPERGGPPQDLATKCRSQCEIYTERPKTLELTFAGRICGDNTEPLPGRWPNCGRKNVGYSQGVRQEGLQATDVSSPSRRLLL
ncbi:hypothetical protein FOA52_012440 [Chlamydomonas sp. UWO 241]|nr:hypothetical protein FOA52_012440 [Chlamydomonas sp. UWO 241]